MGNGGILSDTFLEEEDVEDDIKSRRKYAERICRATRRTGAHICTSLFGNKNCLGIKQKRDRRSSQFTSKAASWIPAYRITTSSRIMSPM